MRWVSHLRPTRTRWFACALAALAACDSYDTGLLAGNPDAGERDNTGGIGGGAEAGQGEGGGMAGDGGQICGQPDDADNCGSCGHVCVAEHGEAACARGTCWVAECDDGFANCDEDQLSCETSTHTLATCGSCNSSCLELPNAVPSCDRGACLVARCEPGYGDCDDRADNGCETSLGTLEHCGGCDVPCAKRSCAGGICTAADCAPGEGDCDGDGASCETDLYGDPDNCGECGASCAFAEGVTPNGDLACSATGCAVACDDGFADCDGDYTTGCEASGDDRDDDGFPDCTDACPDDPEKQQAGECGCGQPETDRDGDETPDCDDLCPLDATRATECLGFAPANFDAGAIAWSAQPSATLDCGTTTVDTTDPDGSGPLVATITGWCGTAPAPVAQDQSGGAQLVILPLRGLMLGSGNTLRLIGSRPVVIAVDGDVTVAGTIDANASGTTPGAGGNASCGSSAGGNGSGDTARFSGASGGGGGGCGTAGGRGGIADTDGSDVNGGSAGTARGNPELMPLLGGCSGGRAGGCSTNGGAGGGALQITASGSIAIAGTLRANGAAGATPCGQNDEGGGTGGGSGGALLLEATNVDTAGATLQTNGAAGGKNGNYAGIYNCGGANGGGGSTSASNAGGNGTNCQGGSPGGGGGYGRQRTIVH